MNGWLIGLLIVMALAITFSVYPLFKWLNIGKSTLKEGAPAGKDSTPPAEKEKTEDKKKGKKKGFGLFSLLMVAVIAVVLTWGYFTSWWGIAVTSTPIRSPVSVQQVTLGEGAWILEWSLPPGQTLIGYNKHAVDVEITRNDNQEFWAVLHDSSSGVDVKVGGLRLGKTPQDDLIGAWSNYLDGDGGQCFLYKKDGYWKGYHTLSNGRKIDIELKRK